jgi:hypothetical protein
MASMAPMSPCPISKQGLEVMRRIPAGALPLINQAIEFEMLERYARRQPNNKALWEDHRIASLENSANTGQQSYRSFTGGQLMRI